MAVTTKTRIVRVKGPPPFVPGYIHIRRANGGFILETDRQHHTPDVAVAYSAEELMARVEAFAHLPGKPPAIKR